MKVYAEELIEIKSNMAANSYYIRIDELGVYVFNTGTTYRIFVFSLSDCFSIRRLTWLEEIQKVFIKTFKENRKELQQLLALEML